MFSPATEPLRQVALALRTATRASRWRLALVVFGWIGGLALLFARHGTLPTRLGAAGAIGASLMGILIWHRVEGWRAREPERVLGWLGRRGERAPAERALRALSLANGSGQGVSSELARLHIARSLARLPSDKILANATKSAARVSLAALLAGGCWVVLAAFQATSVLEGADILFARHGVAPLSMTWLDGVELSARPPDYLHQSAIDDVERTPVALPVGSIVTVRGSPLRSGRRLLLSDGAVEVPFVEDGSGVVVARWPLTGSCTLRAVARFGDAVIPGSEALRILAIPDAAPVVTLEGAPRQVQIAHETADIPIRYAAEDDHGLREVQLVLRSGEREDRRVLSRLDGETKNDRGGLVLRLTDPFFKKSYAPVEVTVEAKDNDPV
ncbi:MAG: DUF4175 family protein, partial [Gaiellaceae bacterium]